jgi:hypothetical protein
MTLDKKALEAATDEAISSVADITARAKSMNLGLVKYFVPEIELLLAALATPPAKPGVQVAGLVWLPWPGSDDCRAVTPWGVYYINKPGDDWTINFDNRSGLGSTATIKEAQAKAQADYTARILSALVSEGKP